MQFGTFRAAQRSPAGNPDGFDYLMLTASLQAWQAASATARAHDAPAITSARSACPQAALAELLLGGPRWRDAVDELGGCFNPGHARHKLSGA